MSFVLIWITSCIVLFNSCTWSKDTLSPAPNILLIYADDLAYADLSCYGKPFGNDFTETPNIDRLAKEGMRFTQAYASAPICTASRAALLTGKSPARLGFEFVTKYPEDTFKIDDKEWRNQFSNRKLIPPPYTLTLPLEEVTIAEYLKQEGYHTGMVGKWHVAPHHKHYKGWSPTHGPKQQGFEWAMETFGAHPYGLSGKQRNQSFSSAGGVFPLDSVTINAIDFLRSRKKEKKPFFLFVSHYFVHTPLDSRIDWLIAKYAKKSGGKYDQKVVEYAAFIEMLDHYVGQLLNELHALGLAESTLVLFTSDNGGHPQHAFNRPLKGSKWNLYEGGIRVPMIVSWPDRIPKNSISEAPIIQTDYLPTFLDIVREKPIDLNLDGVSILEVLKGKKPDQIKDRALIWHFPYYHPEGQKFDMAKDSISIEDGYISKTYPQSAIRMNNEKLIYFYEEENYEYYDLGIDKNESNDLKHQSHEGAEQLKNLLFRELEKRNARFPIMKTD